MRQVMDTVGDWLERHPYIIMLIMLAAVVIPGFLRVEGVSRENEELARQNNAQTLENQRLVECITDWSEEVATRADALATSSLERQNALDRIVRVIASQERTEQQFREAIAAYIAASDAYQQAAEDFPVPEPPVLRCNHQ